MYMYVKERKQVILCIKSNCRHVDVPVYSSKLNKMPVSASQAEKTYKPHLVGFWEVLLEDQMIFELDHMFID